MVVYIAHVDKSIVCCLRRVMRTFKYEVYLGHITDTVNTMSLRVIVAHPLYKEPQAFGNNDTMSKLIEQ